MQRQSQCIGNSSFFHIKIMIKESKKKLLTWSALETYEPNAMFGTCLDSDLNKPTEKMWMGR